MFKRTNKITALLVAAAAVVSIVPATAANASDRLESKDGTVTNAVAYKDGKYVYQGYKSDDDDEAIYYNAGDKDKELDDIQDADLNVAYQDKYAFANDGSDQYLVDLTNGDVIDDETPEDSADTAATKLKTKLKKTDRYGSDISIESEDLGYDDSSDNSTAVLPGNKYGDSWYSYKVKLEDDADANYNAVTEDDGNKYLYGFTDNSGNYIDASNVANIYAYSTAKGKMVKIEEFSNDKDDVDDDSELLATLIGQPVVLTQDKKYIYTLTTVAITDTADGAKATGGTTTSAAAAITDATGATTIRTYIQKISKEQGDQVDDAYVPKTVESYEVGNKDGEEYDCGDAKDAYEAITDVLGDDLTAVTQENVVLESEGKIKPLFTVVDGKLVVIDITTDNIKATTINFKKDKVEFDNKLNLPAYKDDANGYDIDDKVDVYLAEKDDDNDVDLDVDDTDDLVNAYDIDVDGNIWVVADGKIYKFANNEFTKVYTTDSSLDQISVYDEKNIIAWQVDGDIYTTVNEGATGTAADKDNVNTTTAAAATTTKSGWSQLADGTWNFYDATGAKVVANWENIGGVWYYLKTDGVMATGWLNNSGTWYYLNASGAMQTGWINDNGTWYYCNASGAMLSSTVVDGYVLNASGAWVK